MIRPEDRPIVAMMATQIYCARIQSNSSAKQLDAAAIAGEAVALLGFVDRHLGPHRVRPGRVNTRAKAVELDFTSHS